MKRLAFAIGVLALGFAGLTPARADFAVVQYENGRCQIWWDSGADPWGYSWSKIVVGLPDWPAAAAALYTARAQNICP
jgi:hypothetical protein